MQTELYLGHQNGSQEKAPKYLAFGSVHGVNEPA